MAPAHDGRLGPLQVGIILLTLGTALTHMSLLFPDVIFILNGLGYLALLAALYLPRFGVLPWLAEREGLVRGLLIGYTLLAIVLWLAFGLRAPIGYINKANELLLLLLLGLEWRQASTS
jgi:hypothetical protein